MDDDFINKNSLFLPFDDIFNDFIKMDQKITKKEKFDYPHTELDSSSKDFIIEKHKFNSNRHNKFSSLVCKKEDDQLNRLENMDNDKNISNKTIFQTIKKKRKKTKSNNLQDLLKLYYNRISAKQSRQRRKLKIDALEKRIKNLEDEIRNYKTKFECSLNEPIQELRIIEQEIISSNYLGKKTNFIRDFKTKQKQVCISITRMLIKILLPHEFNQINDDLIKFKDLTSIKSLKEIKEILDDNLKLLNSEIISKSFKELTLKTLYKKLDNIKRYSSNLNRFISLFEEELGNLHKIEYC